MAKQKPVIIRTPYPSTESVARELGVSMRRLKEIRKLFGLNPENPGTTKRATLAKKRAAAR